MRSRAEVAEGNPVPGRPPLLVRHQLGRFSFAKRVRHPLTSVPIKEKKIKQARHLGGKQEQVH